MGTPAANKAYWERNKERTREARKEAKARYYALNKERFREERREYAREYRKRFPEKAKAAADACFAANKEKYRSRRLEKQFGITGAQWDALFESQGRVCGCCGADNPGSTKKGWQTDHCHFGGQVRAILCLPCNRVLTEHFELNVSKFVDFLALHSGLSD